MKITSKKYESQSSPTCRLVQLLLEVTVGQWKIVTKVIYHPGVSNLLGRVHQNFIPLQTSLKGIMSLIITYKYIFNPFYFFSNHLESHNSKYDYGSKYWCATICHCNQQSISKNYKFFNVLEILLIFSPQTIVVDRIIWTVSYQASKGETKGKENLSSCLQPHSWIQQ